MTHGSLFSGIGGFDLAAEWMEWDNVFHCEWNDFGKKVLKYYWPKAISYDDITKTDFSVHRGRIDILSGGFPCQPYSQAGKRLGKEDDRHLWPEMLRAIREIEPSYVVGENVLGLTNWNGGLVFEEVQTDLEAEGYEVQPFILPASGVNAPHQRQRVWFVAKNTNKNGWRSDQRKENPEKRRFRNTGAGDNERIQAENGKVRPVANSNGTEQTDNGRANSQEKREVRRDEKGDVSGELFGFGNATDTESKSCGRELQQRQKQGKFRGCNSEGNAPDTGSSRQQTDYTMRKPKKQIISSRIDGENISPDTDNEGCKRNRTQPKPKEQKQTGTGYWDDVRKNTWQNFPTQSPICGGDDGLPSQLDGITFPKWRNESIKAYGNAIVPQVAYQIFKAINQVNK